MATIDVRKSKNEKVTGIKFSECIELNYAGGAVFIMISDQGDEVDLNGHDIDFLIEALKTAKKLWFLSLKQNTVS